MGSYKVKHIKHESGCNTIWQGEQENAFSMRNGREKTRTNKSRQREPIQQQWLKFAGQEFYQKMTEINRCFIKMNERKCNGNDKQWSNAITAPCSPPTPHFSPQARHDSTEQGWQRKQCNTLERKQKLAKDDVCTGCSYLYMLHIK